MGGRARPTRLEPEDERERLVDGPNLGGIQATGRPSEALGSAHRRLLDQDPRLAAFPPARTTSSAAAEVSSGRTWSERATLGSVARFMLRQPAGLTGRRVGPSSPRASSVPLAEASAGTSSGIDRQLVSDGVLAAA